LRSSVLGDTLYDDEQFRHNVLGDRRLEPAYPPHVQLPGRYVLNCSLPPLCLCLCLSVCPSLSVCLSSGCRVYYSAGGQSGVLLLHPHTRGKSNIPPADGRPVVMVFHSTCHSGELTVESNFTALNPNPNGRRWSKDRSFYGF